MCSLGGCSLALGGLLFSRRAGRCGFFSGQSGVHRGIGADFVIATVGPSHDGEIADIDLCDAVLANGNPAEDSISDGDRAQEKLALLVDPLSGKTRSVKSRSGKTSFRGPRSAWFNLPAN